MKEHLFRKTLEDIQSYSETLMSVLKIGLEHGIPEEELTLTNARQKAEKLSRERLKHEILIQNLGYSSLGIALKALSQYKKGDSPIDINHLPEVFHKVPSIWLSGKPKTKKDPGFAPLRVKDAERQHRVMAPLLAEAWDLADDEIKDVITKEYLSSSAAEFERNLYKYINDLEEVSFEEELEQVMIEKASSSMEEMKTLRLLESVKDYGVGGSFEE
jgi:hypothetical protein